MSKPIIDNQEASKFGQVSFTINLADKSPYTGYFDSEILTVILKHITKTEKTLTCK